MAKLCLQTACAPGSPDLEGFGCSKALSAPHGAWGTGTRCKSRAQASFFGTCPKGRAGLGAKPEATGPHGGAAAQTSGLGSYLNPLSQPDLGQAVFQGCCQTSGGTNLEGSSAHSV